MQQITQQYPTKIQLPVTFLKRSYKKHSMQQITQQYATNQTLPVTFLKHKNNMQQIKHFL
jgi:hypothetical protein